MIIENMNERDVRFFWEEAVVLFLFLPFSKRDPNPDNKTKTLLNSNIP